MTSASADFGGTGLLSALTEFTNQVLHGDTPTEIWPVLLGASLTALKKKDGGIHPIGVGAPFAV